MRPATTAHAHRHRDKLQHWFALDILFSVGASGPQSITEWIEPQRKQQDMGRWPFSPLCGRKVWHSHHRLEKQQWAVGSL